MDAVASGMESADEPDYPPGSTMHFDDVAMLANMALDRLRDAGIPGSGQTCQLSSFRRFLERLRLPAHADIGSIQAV